MATGGGRQSRGYSGGAWLVPLASIHDPLLVTQAVFSALGVHDLSAGLSPASLAEYLAGKRLLLVLDNCEHLLDGCAVLASPSSPHARNCSCWPPAGRPWVLPTGSGWLCHRCRCPTPQMKVRWNRPWALTLCGC